MTRAPFQVLVFPYRFRLGTGFEYAVFRRADLGFWQGIAGGGEDAETPLEAAKREALEEGGIPRESTYLALDSTATIPVVDITGELLWGDDVLVVPEHCFGVETGGLEITLSQEHLELRWVGYEAARALLKYDNNKTALWELDVRLRRQPSEDESGNVGLTSRALGATDRRARFEPASSTIEGGDGTQR